MHDLLIAFGISKTSVTRLKRAISICLKLKERYQIKSVRDFKHYQYIFKGSLFKTVKNYLDLYVVHKLKNQNMEDNTTKIIITIIALVAAIIGRALISINKSRKRNTKTNQDSIKIKGNKNKVIGGDDNSKG
jgi:hypothetical protein